MIKHRIPLYQSNPRAGDLPDLFFVGLVPAILSLVSILLLVPNWYWFFGLLPMAVHLMLWWTNERRGMLAVEVEVWKQYRGLSKESQDLINLTPEYVKSLPFGHEWETLKERVKRLYDEERSLRNIKGVFPETSQRVAEAIDERLASVANEKKIALEVNEEARARERMIG